MPPVLFIAPGTLAMQVSLVHVTIIVCPFRLQPPHVPCRRFSELRIERDRLSASLLRDWASPFPSRLAKTHGRIEFTIRLRTRHSPSHALHDASRRRSQSRIRDFTFSRRGLAPRWFCYTPRRTRVRLGGRGNRFLSHRAVSARNVVPRPL